MECILFVILVYLLFTENKNGVNFPDDESVAVSVQTLTALTTYHFPCASYTNRVPPNYVLLCVCYVSLQSTDTLRPEQDISPKDGDGCPESRSANRSPDTTAVSAVSTRPGLNRQGKQEDCLMRACVCARLFR